MNPADIVKRDRLADTVCHDEQMTIWESEVLDEFHEFLREPGDYEETLAMHRAARAAIRHIVEGAFSHSELLGIAGEGGRDA